MTNPDAMHQPTPEFRASLEREVIHALRRETRSRSRFARFRTPMTLAAGLVLGAGAQLAVGQVQKGRARSELEVGIEVKQRIAASRLELARATFERAKKSFDVGAISRTEFLAAEADLRAMETTAYRVQLEFQEVGETAAAPRDELWAPLVGGRDFVKDRLNADAAAAQSKLAAAEAAAADVERRFRAGVAGQNALDDARSSMEQAKADLELIAYKLTLRRQALDQNVTPEMTTRRLERFEVAREIQRAERQLTLAQDRLKTAREGRAVGTIEEVEVLRLQVKVLEQEEEMRRLRAQWQRMGSAPE